MYKIYFFCTAIDRIAVSSLSGFKVQSVHVRKLQVTWGLAVVFAGSSGLLHHWQMASDDLDAIWQIQYKHSMSAPIDQTSACAWLYKHSWLTCQWNKPSTSMSRVACKSMLRSVVRSSMARKLVWQSGVRSYIMSGLATVLFSVGIKCRRCRWRLSKFPIQNSQFFTMVL